MTIAAGGGRSKPAASGLRRAAEVGGLRRGPAAPLA
jgi:hypothetical protein